MGYAVFQGCLAVMGINYYLCQKKYMDIGITKQKIEIWQGLPSLYKRAVIVSHHNPDGDAVGSALCLYHYLLKKSIKARIIFPNIYPDFLAWMFKDEDVSVYSEKKHDEITRHISEADIIFGVDFNTFERTYLLKDVLKNSKAYKVLIDHHLSPDTESFDLVFSTTETAATASYLYDIIDAAGDKPLIDKTMAEAIYVAMVTDTGSFSYNANNPHTYDILKHLFTLGIDGAGIQRLVFNNFTEKRMRLFGICLSQNLVVLKKYKTAYIRLSIGDLKKYSYRSGDTEGIVNYAMAIKGVDMAALFIERKGLTRVSLRSYGNLYVNKIANDLYEGGGHKNAAGANSYESLDKTIEKFEKVLPRMEEYRG